MTGKLIGKLTGLLAKGNKGSDFKNNPEAAGKKEYANLFCGCYDKQWYLRYRSAVACGDTTLIQE
jgi:hypothetical protein